MQAMPAMCHKATSPHPLQVDLRRHLIGPISSVIATGSVATWTALIAALVNYEVNHVPVVTLASKDGVDMADDLMRFLAQFDASRAATTETEFSEAEVADCIIAIFKQLVLADGAIKVAEIAAVTEIIRTDYSRIQSSNPQAAGEFDLERMMQVDERSLASIALILRRSLSADQLDRLRENLVSVAMTDGELHPFEEDLINLFDELTRHPQV